MKLGSLLLEVLVVLPSPSQQLLDCFFNIIDLNFTPKVTQLGIGRTKFLFFIFYFKKKKENEEGDEHQNPGEMFTSAA